MTTSSLVWVRARVISLAMTLAVIGCGKSLIEKVGGAGSIDSVEITRTRLTAFSALRSTEYRVTLKRDARLSDVIDESIFLDIEPNLDKNQILKKGIQLTKQDDHGQVWYVATGPKSEVRLGCKPTGSNETDQSCVNTLVAFPKVETSAVFRPKEFQRLASIGAFSGKGTVSMHLMSANDTHLAEIWLKNGSIERVFKDGRAIVNSSLR